MYKIQSWKYFVTEKSFSPQPQV